LLLIRYSVIIWTPYLFSLVLNLLIRNPLEMRLKPKIAQYFKQKTACLQTRAEAYLFGSRVRETKRGGDIDILILSEDQISRKTLRQIKIDFYKEFGLQKLDLVNFTYDEQHPFKSLIMDEAIRL